MRLASLFDGKPPAKRVSPPRFSIFPSRVLTQFCVKTPRGRNGIRGRVEQIARSLRKSMVERRWNGFHPWQWREMEPLFPPAPKKPFLRRMRKGGRPRIDDRKSLETIFWSIRTGNSPRHAPVRFGPWRTAHRRWKQWGRWGILEKAWSRYLNFTSLEERQEWRRALAGGRGYWQMAFRATLEIEWAHDPAPEKMLGVWE